MNQQRIAPLSLDSESLVDRAYSRVAACADDSARIMAAAAAHPGIFDDFYCLLCEYPYRAKCAFETMDPHASIHISKERLGLYSRYIEEHGPQDRGGIPGAVDDTRLGMRSMGCSWR